MATLRSTIRAGVCDPGLFQRPRRGIILADAVMAIGILMLLGTAVTAERFYRLRATQHLENIRIATAEAELTLSQMQQGESPHSDTSDAIVVEAADGGAPPTGWRWVRITARHGGQTATLVGLARPGGGR